MTTSNDRLYDGDDGTEIKPGLTPAKEVRRWGASLRLESNGNGRNTRIWLEGVELRAIRSFDLRFRAAGLVEAEISFNVEKLDVNTQAILTLVGMLDERSLATIQSALTKRTQWVEDVKMASNGPADRIPEPEQPAGPWDENDAGV
jgi:hypothetical protein